MQKKNQEKMEEYNGFIADARALANPTPPTSTRMGKGLGQGSSVPRPPSSPPPGGCYTSCGKASRKRQMVGEGKGEAIKGAMKKARQRKGKGGSGLPCMEGIAKRTKDKKSICFSFYHPVSYACVQ